VSDGERRGTALGQVLELAILLNDDMTRALARDGLTVARTHLLWELHRRGPSTQRVLADALGGSPRNITGLVDGLVATGFVTREPHPGDRRAALVSPTAHGTRTASRMEEERAHLAELLFSTMSERQFDGFADGLELVLTRLREEITTAGKAGP
jgi:DNA-binding MarR family transcriptional regulator